MKAIKISMAGLIGLTFALAMIGLLIEPTRNVNSIRINAPLARVWDIATDVSRQEWRSDLSMFEVIEAEAGKQEWLEDYVDESLLTINKTTVWKYHQQWVIEFESTPYQGTWNIRLEQIDGTGVKVELIETSILKNPIVRVVRAILFRSGNSIAHVYLEDLKKQVELSIVPNTKVRHRGMPTSKSAL